MSRKVCMFKYLKDINPLLNQRYMTIIRNIKAGSESFYDSLGNLVDNYLKGIADKEKITLEPTFSSGRILDDSKFREFLFDRVKISRTDYKSFRNMVRFINEHKHENEKALLIDVVLKNLEIFFNVYVAVAKHYNHAANEFFDSDYFKAIFKENVQEIKRLQHEILSLKEKLEKEKNISLTHSEVLKNINALENFLPEVETLNELSITLNKLKDIEIETLNTKIDNALALLLELGDSIRENRILSLANINLITGTDNKFFNQSILKSMKIINDGGFLKYFENRPKNNEKVEDLEFKD